MENIRCLANVTEVGVGQRWEEEANYKRQIKSRYSQARSSGVSILVFFLLTPSLQLRLHTSFRPQSFPPYLSFSINISSPMALLSLFSISSFFQAIFCGVSFLSLISTLSSTVSLNLISHSSITHPDGNKNSFDFSLLLIINGQISPTLPLSSPPWLSSFTPSTAISLPRPFHLSSVFTCRCPCRLPLWGTPDKPS